MNLRQQRMAQKMTISELSQATRIEAEVLRGYEFNGSTMTKNHEWRINSVFKDRKVFFGMLPDETKLFVDWKMGGK